MLAVEIEERSGIQYIVLVDVEVDGFLGDGSDSQTLIERAGDPRDRRDRGNTLHRGARESAGSKFRVVFPVGVSRQDIFCAGRIRDIANLVQSECCWYERGRGGVEVIGISRQQTTSALFQSSPCGVISACRRTVISGQRGLHASGDNQRDGHDTDQEQGGDSDEQRDSYLGFARSPMSGSFHSGSSSTDWD